MQTFVILLALIMLSVQVVSFNSRSSGAKVARHSDVRMGLFDGLFGSPKPEAAARHILMKGKEGEMFLGQLKGELASSSNVEAAFAEAATKYSTCPSAKNGGSLGQFKQGAMVPAFDKVVFSEEIGKIHGPVKTPFGAHLIFIQDRFENK